MSEATGNGSITPRVLLAVPDTDLADGFRRTLGDHPRRPLIETAGTEEEALAAASETRPDIVLVDVRLSSGRGFDTVKRLVAEVPGLSVLLVTPKAGTDDFRRALQVGARDMLQVPIAREDLYTAIDAALEVTFAKRAAIEGLSAKPEEPERATGIAVFSTKGGTGKTFIATNLAAGLARTGRRVALIDLDLQFGDAAIALGLVPERTIYDLVQTYTEFDEQLIRDFMISHGSGLQLLPAPLFPDQSTEITSEDIERVLEVVGPAYDYVVIDNPPFFEERVLVALEWADTVLHVGSMDLPTIKNMKVTFGAMKEMSRPRDNVRLVMNRADSRVGLEIADAEKHLGTQVNHTVSSSIEVPRALNAGETILLSKPGSKVGRELSQIVSGFEQSPQNGNPRGLRFLRRS